MRGYSAECFYLSALNLRMKKVLSLLILIAGLQAAQAQPRLPKFIRRMLLDKYSSRKASFFLLPVFSSAPETGVELGASALYSFYSDTAYRSTRVSNIFGYASVTTKHQQHLSLSSSYWAPGNTTHYSVAVSYINFPFDFYGIGNNTLKANRDRVSEKRLKLNFGEEKRLGRYLYIGYVLGGYNYRYRDEQQGGIFNSAAVQYPQGGAGLLAGPSLTFDSRNNNTYTTKGTLVTSYLNVMHGVGMANRYEGAFFNIEFSQFIPLAKRLVLGLDIQNQNLLGGQSPFYLLPALGSDELMRGYYNGRYRDRNFIAGQAELRYRVTDRFGLDGFAATGEVFHSSFDFNGLKPDYGGGLRYFFDVEKGLTLRIDYGIGQKLLNEPRQSGLYLSLGEAF